MAAAGQCVARMASCGQMGSSTSPLATACIAQLPPLKTVPHLVVIGHQRPQLHIQPLSEAGAARRAACGK